MRTMVWAAFMACGLALSAHPQTTKPPPADAAPRPAAPASRPYNPLTFTDEFDRTMWNGVLFLGDEPPWHAEVRGGYRLRNDTSQAAIRLVTAHFGAGDVPIPMKSIEADVVVESAPDPNSGVGVSFQHDDTTGPGYVFIITRGNGYAVYECDGSGCAKKLSGTSDQIHPGLNTVRAEYSNGRSVFSINGTQVADFSSDAIRGRDAGLAAVGRGSFVFKRVVRLEE